MATLTDLFQSYAQLKPFEYELAEIQIDPLYENYDRAKSATQTNPLDSVAEATTAWKVGGDSKSPYNWVVGYMVNEPDKLANSTFNNEGIIPYTFNGQTYSYTPTQGAWYEDSLRDIYKISQKKLNLSSYWYQQMKRIGLDDFDV